MRPFKSHHPESYDGKGIIMREEIGRRFYGFRLCEAQEQAQEHHEAGFRFTSLFLLLVSKIILILGEIFKIKLRNFQNY